MSLASPASVRPRTVRTDPLARMLAWAGHSAFTVAATLLVVLHLDPDWGGGEDPVTAMLSEYALTPGHWAWALALTLTSAGSAAVLVSLRRTGVLAGSAAPAWLSVWCVAIALVAVFSKDPQGGAVSLTGKLHLYATGVSCAALPVAGLVLARAHRDHPAWRRFARWSRWLALASVPFFLPFIVPFAVHVLLSRGLPTPATGLVERVMAGLELALLTLFAFWAHRASHSTVHTGHTAETSQDDQREQAAL